MARAALRLGELAGCRWLDIAFLDDGTATITVREARHQGEVSTPKCKARKLREPNYVPKSLRTIALSKDLADALRRHQQVQEELGRTHKDNLVFTTRTGAVLRPSNFRLDVFNDAVTVALATGKVHVKGANPKPITPHTLRHTAITEWASQGVPPHIIMDRAGHEDFATTLRYIGRGLKDKMEAMKKVSEAWAKTIESTSRDDD